MIFNRPTNLWLGLVTAVSGAVAATLILGFKLDPVLVGTLAGVWQGVLGAGVLLVANQPPTVNSGDTVTVATPKGQANVEITVPCVGSTAAVTAKPTPKP